MAAKSCADGENSVRRNGPVLSPPTRPWPSCPHALAPALSSSPARVTNSVWPDPQLPPVQPRASASSVGAWIVLFAHEENERRKCKAQGGCSNARQPASGRACEWWQAGFCAAAAAVVW